MGLKQKLLKIKATKDALKNLLQLAEIIDEGDTFEEYVDKLDLFIYTVMKSMYNCSTKVIDKNITFTDALGIVETTAVKSFIALGVPKSYRYNNKYAGECCKYILNTTYSKIDISGTLMETTTLLDYVDLSNIIIPNQDYVSFYNGSLKVNSKTVLLPKCDYVFSSYAIALYNTTRGLILQGNVKICKSDSLNPLGNTFYIPIILPDNFEGDFYISKFTISEETMVNMFSKLKDLTGTGKSYTLNLGSTNLARLTDDQKNIAYEKGWTLT